MTKQPAAPADHGKMRAGQSFVKTTKAKKRGDYRGDIPSWSGRIHRARIVPLRKSAPRRPAGIYAGCPAAALELARTWSRPARIAGHTGAARQPTALATLARPSAGPGSSDSGTDLERPPRSLATLARTFGPGGRRSRTAAGRPSGPGRTGTGSALQEGRQPIRGRFLGENQIFYPRRG